MAMKHRQQISVLVTGILLVFVLHACTAIPVQRPADQLAWEQAAKTDRELFPDLFARLHQYEATQRQLASSNSSNTRGLIVVAQGGDGVNFRLGNRLLSLMSSFYFALAQGHHFLVYWEGLDEILVPPSEWGEWDFIRVALARQWTDELLVPRARIVSVVEPVPRRRPELQLSARQMMGRMGCGDLATDERLSAPRDDFAVLHVLGNQYWLPLVYLNPSNAAMRPLFVPTGGEHHPSAVWEVFGPLARYLFRLHPVVRQHVLQFRERELRRAQRVIGVHVRTELLGEGVGNVRSYHPSPSRRCSSRS
jgi:hypothetical protein